MSLFTEHRLSYKEKKKLPKGSFAEPGKRKYPIEDPAHARNALARVSAHGTPAEKKQVRGAVHRRYPSIGESKTENFIAHQLVERLLA